MSQNVRILSLPIRQKHLGCRVSLKNVGEPSVLFPQASGLAMLGCHFPPGKVPALSPGDFDYERCWHGFFHGMVNGGPMMDPSLGNVQTLVV